MLVNYKFNISTITSGSTGTTFNIPINLESQIVDNSELIERVFVETETQKAVNPILDYDKARFTPIDGSQIVLGVTYNLHFLDQNGFLSIPSTYSTIGFDDSDIKFGRSNFKESHVQLSFYDSDNTLTQNLVSEVNIFSVLTKDDFWPSGVTKPNIAGQPKSVDKIPVRFKLSNPKYLKRGFYEGFYLYDYKDEYVTNQPKSLYMKATYFNGKTGKSTNLMTEPSPYKIDNLVNKLYTKYNLYRDTTGFFYDIDTTYSNNVTYTTNQNKTEVSIRLYQIQVF